MIATCLCSYHFYFMLMLNKKKYFFRKHLYRQKNPMTNNLPISIKKCSFEENGKDNIAF